MSDSNQTENNDIDLLDWLNELRNNKKTILILIITSILIGSLYYINQKIIYESRIYYSIQSKPPFYSFERPNLQEQSTKLMKNQLQKIFYSENTFEGWKKANLIPL